MEGVVPCWAQALFRMCVYMGVCPTGAYYWKREPAWTNLRGMWGKRSALGEADADAVDDDHGNHTPAACLSRTRAPTHLLSHPLPSCLLCS